MAEFPAVTEQQWRDRVLREMGETGLDALETETVEGFRLQPLYTEASPDGAGFPGMAPFVRGAHPVTSTSGWERCQCYQEPEIEVAAAQIAADTANGVDGVWIRLDRAARMGLDPTSKDGLARVGDDGMAAYTAADLAAVLGAGESRAVGFSFDAGGNALPLAALALVALQESGIDPAAVPIRFNADPLGALARDGSLPAPHATLGWEAAVLARYCEAKLPRARALTVSVVPYGRAGASGVQELGFAMATAIEYLRTLSAAGVDPESGAAQIALSFELGRDFLTELCKLRAARWLWSKVLVACEVADPPPPLVHAGTSARTLACQDPCVNLLRITVQAVAASVGGADSITTAAFDEPIGRSSARARRLARNTQAILREEAHLGLVTDAAGGSYAVEALTETLAREAWSLLRSIDAIGMAEALIADPPRTHVRNLVDDAYKTRRARLRDGRDPVLGASHFPPLEPELLERPPVDPAAVRAAVEARLSSRAAPSAETLAAVREAAESTTAKSGPDTLMTALLRAARAGATIAELSGALRDREPGEQVDPFPERPDAALSEDPVGAAGQGA